MNLIDRFILSRKHRGSQAIQDLEGEERNSEYRRWYYRNAYQRLEVVNRGVNLIADSLAEINISVGNRLPIDPRTLSSRNANRLKPQYIPQKKLSTLLNFQPNEFESAEEFRRALAVDYILTGNVYIYYDGMYLNHLPSELVIVTTGSSQKITGYKYMDNTQFTLNEIIHIKDNSAESTVTGDSRLRAANDTIRVLVTMLDFQEKFFKNGAVPGLIFTTPNVLGNKLKERIINDMVARYGEAKAARRPLIADADLKPHPLSNQSFRDLDFMNSIRVFEERILMVLGVPPLLLDGGNNANISPNLKMFYEQTILPISNKFISALETYFAYDMEPDLFKTRALRPEMQEAGNYYGALVNNGIMTINEARKELRLEDSPEKHASKLRIPANIAGSASNPSQGGRPSGNGSEDNSEDNK